MSKGTDGNSVQHQIQERSLMCKIFLPCSALLMVSVPSVHIWQDPPQACVRPGSVVCAEKIFEGHLQKLSLRVFRWGIGMYLNNSFLIHLVSSFGIHFILTTLPMKVGNTTKEKENKHCACVLFKFFIL